MLITSMAMRGNDIQLFGNSAIRQKCAAMLAGLGFPRTPEPHKWKLGAMSSQPSPDLAALTFCIVRFARTSLGIVCVMCAQSKSEMYLASGTRDRHSRIGLA